MNSVWEEQKGLCRECDNGQGFEGYLGVFRVIRGVWCFSCSMKVRPVPGLTGHFRRTCSFARVHLGLGKLLILLEWAQG